MIRVPKWMFDFLYALAYMASMNMHVLFDAFQMLQGKARRVKWMNHKITNEINTFRSTELYNENIFPTIFFWLTAFMNSIFSVVFFYSFISLFAIFHIYFFAFQRQSAGSVSGNSKNNKNNNTNFIMKIIRGHSNAANTFCFNKFHSFIHYALLVNA